MKRCIEGNKLFGTALPARNNEESVYPCLEFGSLLYIKNFHPILSDVVTTIDGNLPGYRIECLVRSRFKIHSLRMNETCKYFEAEIQTVVDIEPEDRVPDWDPVKYSMLVETCRKSIQSILQVLSPAAKFHFDRMYGQMPTSPDELSFWTTQFIPVNPYDLYQLLSITSTEKRLEIINEWLKLCTISAAS